jgi:hypothetical protein
MLRASVFLGRQDNRVRILLSQAINMLLPCLTLNVNISETVPVNQWPLSETRKASDKLISPPSDTHYSIISAHCHSHRLAAYHLT